MIRIKQILQLIKIIVMKFFCLFYKTEDYWVIAERGREAKDNGYFFYKFIKSAHPEKRVYYLISNDSPDINKIDENDRIIFGTFKHYIICLKAKAIISTHTYLFFKNCFYKSYRLVKPRKQKIVFLQHGIIKDLIPFYFKKNNKVDLFITSSKYEKEYILQYYGYNEKEVKCTGLSRYDDLLYNKSVQNIILVAPTWRQNYLFINDADFLQTEYYKCWHTFLSDACRLFSNNTQIYFYQHFEFQKFDKFFKDIGNLEIKNIYNSEIHDLLKSSSLLVTDFSSVFFDFAYMKKPLVFFQFDEDEYRQNHYSEGYFNYKTCGFGPVIKSNSDLLLSVKKIIQNNFSVSNSFLHKIDDFFDHHDNNNCKRIYTEIERLLSDD